MIQLRSSVTLVQSGNQSMIEIQSQNIFLDRKMTPEYSSLWLNKGHKNLLYEFPIDITEAVKYPTQIII